MSSLNITPNPWRAFPGQDTTIRQLTDAIQAFPELILDVAQVTFEISFILDFNAGRPPKTDELAAVLYPDDDELIISEDTSVGLRAIDAEAMDRHIEQDLDLGNLDPPV